MHGGAGGGGRVGAQGFPPSKESCITAGFALKLVCPQVERLEFALNKTKSDAAYMNALKDLMHES